MSYSDQQGFSNDSGVGETPSPAEETLRLIARLPAPEGLEDRVQAGLRTAPRRARILSWPGTVPLTAGWLRAAAAAAIVFVVAGGGWGIYSRVEPGQAGRGVAGPRLDGPRLSAPGGFTEGGAVRRPQTLVGPIVVPAASPIVSPAAAHPATDAAPKPKTPARATPPATAGAKSRTADGTTASPAASPVR